MSEQPRYTASKSPTRDRRAWAISFRHPLRRDPRGKQGLKIRRGLGTDNEEEAQRLVDEMNVLLSDPAWHSVTKRTEAEKRFAAPIVRAFYDAIEATTTGSWDVRNEKMPLPGHEAGYARVLFTGATGAGKTSLLRHLIGSDPDKDRFPSTSAARTTIADTEVICEESDTYEAVITFSNEWSVYTNVQECVVAACSALWAQPGLDDEKVADRLLTHRDLRFRMAYTLGSWSLAASGDSEAEDDGWNYGPSDEATSVAGQTVDLPAGFNPETAHGVLVAFVQRIRELTSEALSGLKSDLGEDFTSLSTDDPTAQEWFEEKLQSLSGFDDLVNDVIDEIRLRFDWLETGTLHRGPSGWPVWWHTTSADREEFLRAIRWFSSNHGPLFGTLLTPVVDGLRVRGPFFPRLTAERPNLVLLDGEGLGHAKDAGAAVPIHITRRYPDVDVIVLVDSAKAPMLDGPTSLIRSVAAAGYQKKLVFAFTHFDTLRNQANLGDFRSQKAHVMNALNQALVSLRQVVALPAIHALEREAEERTFILGFLDRLLTAENRGPAGEMIRLLDFCRRSIVVAPPPAVHPVYDAVRLLFALQTGTRDFHDRWDSLLGFRRSVEVEAAHWATVKALNRRIVQQTNNGEYGKLRPVADLLARLSEAISKFLAAPDRWEPEGGTEQQREEAVARIQRTVWRLLDPFATDRLLSEARADWVTAFDFRGYGSTSKRARTIQGIYESQAPIPGEPLDSRAAAFMRAVRRLVHDAIEAEGGKMVSEVIG